MTLAHFNKIQDHSKNLRAPSSAQLIEVKNETTTCKAESNGKVLENDVSELLVDSEEVLSKVNPADQLLLKLKNYPENFGTGQVYYYGANQNYGTLANSGINLTYHYRKADSASINSQCEMKWGFFYVCSYNQKSYQGTFSKKVSNQSIDLQAKVDEITSHLKNANPLIPVQVNGTVYTISLKSGEKFIVDTRYPLQANPLAKMDIKGNSEYLTNISEE